ncbi:glutamyl-tRNA reductase [candidate division KSB3 bacterium]|uniref:Glutamyl-tRNA reductase n=1 Tax=candidate division KSB3 bacterium TaxID=2044937 RepID=A0A2G6KBK0_9BACT|nr:MAG: glutamyl-tRNA reductase [candidate division KSB3 bacterium]
MGIIVFGINHSSAELGQLELISLDDDEVRNSLYVLSHKPDIEELVILSTCNRTEFYAVSQGAQAAVQHFIKQITALKGCEHEKLFDRFYLKEEREAHHHIFRVVCGLDSLVIGENEIAGQLKTAYHQACQLETAGMFLHKLFHAAFRTSKRVKNETEINQGCCSVGAAAVDMAVQCDIRFNNATVLLIGAGEIGQVTAKILAKREVGKLLIANRSPQKSVRLAKEVGGVAIPFHRIYELLSQVDVVISSTSAPKYLFTLAAIKDVVHHNPKGHLLIIDIALPRDFDPAIGNLPGVTLKNIYELKEVVDLNLKKREQEVITVERIIEEELQKFIDWQTSLEINPVIQTIKDYIEDIRREELRKYRYRFEDDTFFQVEKFTKGLAGKYMHTLIAQLKSLHENNRLNAENLGIIEELFDENMRRRCR